MVVAGFIFDENIMYWNFGRYQNVLGVTIASEEIECADRIVNETGIHKADVVSIRASEFFLNILKLENWPD